MSEDVQIIRGGFVNEIILKKSTFYIAFWVLYHQSGHAYLLLASKYDVNINANTEIISTHFSLLCCIIETRVSGVTSF